MNSSRLDQGQHSWKQVACEKLPACQHHVRKHSPVCRSPPQAQSWMGMMAMALGQALQYTAPHLCVCSVCEAVIRNDGQGKQKAQVHGAACFSVLPYSSSLTSLSITAEAVLVCIPPCIPNLKQVTPMWSLTCQTPRCSSLFYTSQLPKL